MQNCDEGFWGPCEEQRGNAYEICWDGIDNDCNGLIDEVCGDECASGEEMPCEGECSRGYRYCNRGFWSQSCIEPPPPDEICNGVDDNCNGVVDEGCCEHGVEIRCEEEARDGLRRCVQGRWSACLLAEPPVERCGNGLDDNLNGLIDEGCEPCPPEGHPIEAEKCDLFDNDCNGLVDDTILRQCSTQCGEGTQVCRSGHWSDCTTPAQESEIPNDGLDNDCDGTTDNAMLIVGCHTGSPCQNACGRGRLLCFEDGLQGGAESNGTPGICHPYPLREACDGEDNDCDGGVDEGLARLCESDCGVGTELCSEGSWVSCTAPTDCP